MSDLAVHVAGLVAATAAIPILIFLAFLSDSNDWPVVGTVIYCFALLAMFSCSALYNIFPHPDWEWLFKRLDHAAIYFKIAATYGAFVFIAGHGFLLAGAVWVAAFIGITLKIVCPDRYRWLGLALYIGMGWVAVLLSSSLFAVLPGKVVALVAIGGVTYTAGVVFHLWSGLPFHNTIWHVFVLTATFTMYAGVVVALVA